MSARRAHADGRKTPRQTVEVLAKAKRPACEYRHDLVDAIGEEKAAIKGRNARFDQRHEFAV